MHASNGGLRLRIVPHFDKSKAFGATRVALHHDFGAGDAAELAEGLLQIVIAHGIWQIADVEFVAHARDS
jgi:hypothetical protein